MAEQHLTKSELAIMEVMWEQEEALTASEIIKASGDKEWKNSSIHLMVNALLEKGFLEVAGFKKTTKNYARTFKPTMTKEKYFVRKVMGNTPVEEKKKIYMKNFVVKKGMNLLLRSLKKHLSRKSYICLLLGDHIPLFCIVNR